MQKEKERKKTELSDAGFCFFPVNLGEFTASRSVHPTMGVRSQRSDQVISAQDTQHL